MRTFNIKLNFLFLTIFSLVFFILYFARVNIFSIAIPLFIVTLICILYLAYIYLKEAKIIHELSQFLKSSKYILILLLLMFLFESFNFDYEYNFKLFSQKKTCKNILIFLQDYEFFKLIAFNALCVYSKTLYYVILLITFLNHFINKINLEKIFLFLGLLFSLIAIVHLIIDTYIRLNFYPGNIYEYFKTFNSSNNFAYFQLLPFYSDGFRNVEIYPILVGYMASLNLLNKTNKKKYIYISCFLGVCVFLSFSRVSWVISFVIITYLLFVNYKITIKYLINQFFYFVVFLIIFTYLWNYSDLIFINDSSNLDYIPRSNFFYYTMMKITSLVSTDVSNYFNYLNTSGWYYYNIIPVENIEASNPSGYTGVVELEQIIKDNKETIYNEYIETYMQQHLNSVPARLETYRELLILIKEKFFFGYSANKFSVGIISSDINATLNNPYVKTGNAESDFLQMFVEHGFIGFVIKISLFIYLLSLNIKNKDYFNVSFLLMIIIFSIFVTLSFYFFYWISLAIIISRTHVKIAR